jgi:diguanylate cyclase (GGDEF)-like protein/PAS domain S-box-containing protein
MPGRGTSQKNPQDLPKMSSAPAFSETSATAMATLPLLPVDPLSTPVFGSACELDFISRMVLDTVGEGIFCTDQNGITTFVNPAAARMLGWTQAELLGSRQHDMVHYAYPDGTPYPMDACPVYSAITSGRAVHCEDEVFWRKDGTSFAVAYTSAPIAIGGSVVGIVVVFSDISERVGRDRWQRNKDAVFRAITTHQSLDWILQLLADSYSAYQAGSSIAILLRDEQDDERLCLVASSELSTSLKAKLQSVRIEEEKSVCGRAAALKQEVLTDGGTPEGARFLETAGSDAPGKPAQRCLALPMISANGQVLGVVAFMVVPGAAPNGRSMPIALSLPVALALPPAVAEHGGFRGVRDLAQIAVEHRQLQTELVHQSRHDRLTGLPNRLFIEEQLAHLIRVADRNRSRLAVGSIDLDRFRRVNETHGAVIGDDVLQQIAARLKNVLRKGDIIGRQGGDEFIIVIPGLHDPADADAVCRKLLNALGEPFLVEGKAITIAANIGISIYPDHADTPQLLIQHADTALDFAKEKGKASMKLFRPDLGQKVRQIAARETALQTALQKNEFYLMYQPIVDMSRHVYGFEALLRWQHPDFGLIPPDQFIPLAEDTGLILPIGDWVLREACRQAMSWTVKGLADSKIFVNVSALQLGQSDFTHSVAYALRRSGLHPSRLGLEVTESFIVPSFKKATQRLQPLQDLGVSIAIDDFGTGHSSFSVLHKLPINKVKIDRSFVSRIDKDVSGLSTVRAIINLAHQLNMKTVAEGVETEAQFSLLSEMQCDLYQGYLLSKPLTVEGVQQTFAELALPVPEKTPPAARAASDKAEVLRKSA